MMFETMQGVLWRLG